MSHLVYRNIIIIVHSSVKPLRLNFRLSPIEVMKCLFIKFWTISVQTARRVWTKEDNVETFGVCVIDHINSNSEANALDVL
jgi:hypothetical protein